MLRGILTVGGWTLASRVTGFVRDILIAALAGAGPVADAFFVALRLPNLFRRLFGEGAFNAAFVPAFSGMLAAEGDSPEQVRANARAFAETTLSILALWLVALTILGEIFMPAVMSALAPGFLHDPERFTLAVAMGRITLPYLPLICVCALLAGVLNGLGRFTAAAAAPILFNLCMITALLALRHVLPTAGHALSVGVTISGLAQLWLLLWAVRRAGMRLRLVPPRLSPAIRLLLRRLGPGLVGAGVTQLNLLTDTILASLLPAGSVSLLYYADRVNQLPLGVIGTAIGTALLPLLSRQVRGGDEVSARQTMDQALFYALFLTLPAAIALALCAGPIMEVLFARGAFGAPQAAASAAVLAAYAPGLPAFVLVKVLAPGFFARGDTATPVKIGMVALALNLAFNLSLIWWLAEVGIALSTTLAAWVNCLFLAWVLHRRGQLVISAGLRRRVARMAVAVAVMVVVLLAATHLVYAPLASGRWLRWGGLAATLGLGGGAYLLVVEALGVSTLRDLLRTLRGRRGSVARPDQLR